MLRPFIFFLLLTTAFSPLYAGRRFNTDSIVEALNHIAERRDTHYALHSWKIDSLKKDLSHVPRSEHRERAGRLHQIFNMYKAFQSDSAFNTVTKELQEAQATADIDLITRAKGDLIFSYLSKGAFPDALDIVRGTSLVGVSDSIRGDFYFICQRLFSDISVAQSEGFKDKYASASHAYADSVIDVLPSDSYKAQYASTFKTLPDLKVQDKINIFTSLLSRNDIDRGEKAMIASILGDFYQEKNDPDGQLYYKALSARMDIEAAKRETTSMRVLANMMFQRGQYNLAHKYINVALDDAVAFNAPHRKAETATIFPLIESRRYDTINHERRILWWTLAALALMLISLIVGLFFYFRLAAKLKNTNQRLSETLAKLSESIKIKDEYLGYSFFTQSQYLKKIESLHKLITRKIKARQFDDILQSLRDSDLKSEKERLLNEFDSSFLKLFPTFPEKYSLLFPKMEECEPQNPEDCCSLNPEMRIFALIRLGVTEPSRIASFLNYSVNTVHTYKTRAKNRSHLPNDRFEDAIMAIRSIS